MDLKYRLEIQACSILQCTKSSKKNCCFLIFVQSSVFNKWGIFSDCRWGQDFSPPPRLNNLAKQRFCFLFNYFCYDTLKCQFVLILWGQGTFSCLMYGFCGACAPTISTWNTLRGQHDIDFYSYILLYNTPELEVGQEERRGRNKRK